MGIFVQKVLVRYGSVCNTAKKIELKYGVISTPEPFEIPLIFSSNIEKIDFCSTGMDGYSDWEHNPHMLFYLLTAIAKSSIRKGLKKIYFKDTSLSDGEILELLLKCGLQNIKISKESQTLFTEV